ncbi:MAG: hypothetical protein JSU72_20485 [Deltaproteobacteria bacterium]|nr:MAG: hypothetical protein JSU72_20485 [Deltaproteobacteria bacterium]
MEASYKSQSIRVDGLLRSILIEPGQFVTGRYKLHGDYHLWRKGYKKKKPSARTLWRWLYVIEEMGNLTVESFTKYSLVSILNWNKYQGEGECSTEVFHENEGKNANFGNDFQEKSQNLTIKKPPSIPYAPTTCDDCEENLTNGCPAACPTGVHYLRSIKKSKEEGAEAPLFFCQLFSIPESYLQKLQKEYPGQVDRKLIVRLCSKIEDYCTDNPNRYKRDKHGRLKSPKNVLRNWLERELKDNEKPKCL